MSILFLSPPCVSWSHGRDRHTARIALFAARLLRRVDAVSLQELGIELNRAADERRIPRFSDNSQLTRIMQRLNWRKDGYVGEGASRSPRYVRVATAAQAA